MYDVSTLYTMLDHKNIKEAMKFTITLTFRNSWSKFIAVYEKGYR